MNEKNLPVVFTIFCIDKRFDYLSYEYINHIRLKFIYYLVTSAGSTLSLGYNTFCTNYCNCESNYNPDMELLKNSIIKNLDISMTNLND